MFEIIPVLTQALLCGIEHNSICPGFSLFIYLYVHLELLSPPATLLADASVLYVATPLGQ